MSILSKGCGYVRMNSPRSPTSSKEQLVIISYLRDASFLRDTNMLSPEYTCAIMPRASASAASPIISSRSMPSRRMTLPSASATSPP